MSLIRNINPLTISSITWTRAFRLGNHPSYIKIKRKQNPIRGMLGFYDNMFFDGFYPAIVEIRGSNGKILKSFECNSNKQAKDLYEDLTRQLAAAIETNK